MARGTWSGCTTEIGGCVRDPTIPRLSAGRRPEHDADDEEDQEHAHDERERPDVTRLCRLHDASPPGFTSDQIPGWSIDSIDA